MYIVGIILFSLFVYLIIRATLPRNYILAKKLSGTAKNITEMLSEYTQRLYNAQWNPALGEDQQIRCEKALLTNKINSELTTRFEKHYKSKAIGLLNDAYPLVDRELSEIKEHTKSLTSSFMISGFSFHLQYIAGELKTRK